MARHGHGLISNTRAALKENPKEIFNFYLFFCTFIWSFSGVAKGFDEGNIASLVVMKSFKTKFGLSHQSTAEYANTKGWIVSIATAGAVFGCLSTMALSERLGRKRTLQLFTVIYIVGIFGQTFSNGSLTALYVSKIIAGFGIGCTTLIPSIYLSEIAPKSIRGFINVQYTSCQQLGVVFGFFFNYGITKHFSGTNTQWQLVTALQIIPALIWGLGIFLTPESPRWLLSKNQRAKATAVSCKLRGLPADHPFVVAEFAGMEQQIAHEIEIRAGTSTMDLLKETFSTTGNRRRFLLMFMSHLFSQWSGANAITQYSPTIFGYLGIKGESTVFFATGMYGIVKFVSVVLFSIFIVDFVGRRRSPLTGITIQLLTLVFVGAYLGVTFGMSTKEIEAQPHLVGASKAAIVTIFSHAVGWSIGWFSIPYLVSSEVFPVQIRSLCVSMLMALHWAFYFGCSRAMPSLLAATHKYGAFAFFASICSISLVWAYLAMPETAGRSLESLDSIFDRPWYTIHKVAYPTLEDLKMDGLPTPSKKVDDGESGHGRAEIVQEEFKGSVRHFERGST